MGNENTIPCWNCIDLMRRFARDTFYTYYICDSCKKERMVPREDRAILELPEEEENNG